MSPVWEANHVWLIFVLVLLWTCFPVAFGSIFSTLYVPLFIADPGSSSGAPLSRCAGRRRRLARRACSVPFSHFLGPGSVLHGCLPRGDRLGPSAGRKCLRGPVHLLAQPDLDPGRLAGGRHAGPIWPRCSWPPTPAGRTADLVGAFRGRALASGALPGRSRSVG